MVGVVVGIKDGHLFPCTGQGPGSCWEATYVNVTSSYLNHRQFPDFTIYKGLSPDHLNLMTTLYITCYQCHVLDEKTEAQEFLKKKYAADVAEEGGTEGQAFFP